MNKDQKAAVIEELARELGEANAVLAVDYRGISVPQAAELRTGLREADARFRVVKNRLTLRAADEAGVEGLKDHLSGPTALAFVKGDVALAAKTISRLGSDWELLAYKGGLMDGEALDRDSFVAIAKLPGREALNAQFAGVVASPLTGLVRGLGSMIQGLASQLQQMADQGLVSGEAPAEAPPAEETPAEETPAEEEEAPAEDEEAPAEDAPAEDASAEEPAAESPPDPDPKSSPEESTEEEPAPGEEVSTEEASAPGEQEPAPVTEGDAEIGSASEGAQEETSENSDADKEEDS